MPALEDLITAGDVADGTHSHSGADVTSGTVPIARIPTGTTGTTVPFGNDARFTDSRTPTAHAASHAAAGGDAVLPAAASQAEMEAGTEAALRAVSPLRVAQAIAALAAAGGAGVLLGINVYRPATTTIFSTTSATLADVDATNMAVTFNAPASGNVIVRLNAWCDVGTANYLWLSLRESTTNLGDPVLVMRTTGQAYVSVPIYLSGLTGGSHTYKWSFATDGTGTAGRIVVARGASSAQQFPPAVIEVWSAP